MARRLRYTYDNLYWLTGENITDAINGNYLSDFVYDKVGNRTSETIGGVETIYSYDLNDRLTNKDDTTYSYDDNGSTLSETQNGILKTYTYNSKNKLLAVDNAGVITHYSYNVNGIRTTKESNLIITDFVVDSNMRYAQVLLESDGTDEIIYTYGDDLISQARSSTISYYHVDGLGSTRALTDNAGEIVNTYDYTADGLILNQNGVAENNYLYTGEQRDAETGNYYLRARYYDPSRPGFTQMDTWMGRNDDPVTLNKYIYANVDPVNGIDPSGNNTLMGQMAAFAVLGVGVGLATGVIKPLSLDRSDLPGFDGVFTSKEMGVMALLAVASSSPALLHMALKDQEEVNEYSRVEDELQGIVAGLRERDSSVTITVPWPPQKRRWTTCIARAQDLGRLSGRAAIFGWGWGMSKDFNTAKNMAVQMANTLGGLVDTHHTQWRCIDSDGSRRTP